MVDEKIKKYRDYKHKCKLLGIDVVGAKIDLNTGRLEVSGLNSDIEDLKIPKVFDAIGKGVFELGTRNSDLEKVTIRNNIEEICKDAFNTCITLKEARIDAKIVGIGAFGGCSNLRRVYLGSNVRELWDGAFNGCGSLKKIVLERGLEKIGAEVFSGSGIEVLRIPDSVKFISRYAFLDTSYLKYIEIPDSILEGLQEGFQDECLLSFECYEFKDLRVKNGDLKIKCSDYVFNRIDKHLAEGVKIVRV